MVQADVNRCANALKALGVKKGDRVAIYLPMIPEVAVAMLACARIGAPHSVVFGGFSAEALRDRINDAEAKVLITADLGYRRGQIVPLKRNADEALKHTPSIQHVVVVRRHGAEAEDELVHMQAGRDHWYHELMADAPPDCKPAVMDAEDLLFILYTSGTTGKPKGIVHTTGGYLTQAQATTRWVARPDDIIISADLPKTRSGKIMRRLLKDIASGRALGDVTTLADPAVVASLKTKYEEQEA